MKFVLASLACLFAVHAHALAWTEFRHVGVVQTYGGSFQVYLKDLTCANSKPYFSVDAGQITGLDQLLSMVLMAKASQTRIRFYIDTESNPSFCYVKGLQIE